MWSFLKFKNSQLNCLTAIKSGCIVHNNENLRFLTLTSSSDMNRSITKCFSVLVNRIERLYPLKFVELGLIKRNKLNYYYPNTDSNKNLHFDYLYVLTSEGVNGVLHVLYFGDFIHEKWLKDNWEEITGGARQLIIEKVGNDLQNKEKLSKYMVNQRKLFGYVTSQCKYIRHSYSKNWVYKGWRKDFKHILKVCYSQRYSKFLKNDLWHIWYAWLLYGRYVRPTIQLCLKDYI